MGRRKGGGKAAAERTVLPRPYNILHSYFEREEGLRETRPLSPKGLIVAQTSTICSPIQHLQRTYAVIVSLENPIFIASLSPSLRPEAVCLFPPFAATRRKKGSEGRGGEGRGGHVKASSKKLCPKHERKSGEEKGRGGISQGKSGRERPTTEKREEELKEEIAGDATAVHLQTYTATLALFLLAPEATRGGRRRFESPHLSLPPVLKVSKPPPSFLCLFSLLPSTS